MKELRDVWVSLQGSLKTGFILFAMDVDVKFILRLGVDNSATLKRIWQFLNDWPETSDEERST